MAKKITKDTSEDYQKIRTVCQVMINDLSDKVLNKEDVKYVFHKSCGLQF